MRKVKCNIIKFWALLWPQDGAENESSSRESKPVQAVCTVAKIFPILCLVHPDLMENEETTNEVEITSMASRELWPIQKRA